jgi:hypothetical protein
MLPADTAQGTASNKSKTTLALIERRIGNSYRISGVLGSRPV